MQSTTSLTEFLRYQMPDALELLRQMVGINSFTSNREGVNKLGRFTAECFAPLGFTAEFVPSANPNYGDHLVLTRPGRSKRNVAMVSHLDTVFPPQEETRNQFHWQPEGDRIYGPGTHDIKGGTIMMWLVLQALRAHAPAVFEEITWAGNRTLLGRELEVLVAEGEGRKDVATHRLSGRARDGRLVHFAPGDRAPRPGDIVRVAVTHAAPHHLIADLPPLAVRRTRAGDAWEARASDGKPAGAPAGAVLLGMPAVGRPAC